MPDNSITTTNSTGNLPHPTLPLSATQAQVVPTFKRSLVSIGQICYNGYDALFREKDVVIINNDTNQVEWKGKRNPTTKLWDLPIHTTNALDTVTINIKETYHPPSRPAALPHTLLSNNASATTTLQEHIQFPH